jgi:Rha family phage regulatory protein
MTNTTINASAQSVSIEVINGKPRTTSIAVANHFNKRHDNVLRDIKNLIAETGDWGLLNFEEASQEVPQPNGGVATYAAYHITRDGFTLLAMGFTGKKALQWKIAYIAAFNAMERELLSKTEQSSKNKTRKALPNGLTIEQQDAIKALVKARLEDIPQDRRAKAAITCWSALKSHFGCSYKEITPEKFTDAISLVARQVLVGELVEPEALPSAELNIDYPLRRWVDENPAMRQSAGWSGDSSVLITPRMLCGTESRSPTLQLLSKLAEAGHNVEAYVVEVESLRHHVGMMSNRIRQIASDCEDTISRGLRSKLH